MSARSDLADWQMPQIVDALCLLVVDLAQVPAGKASTGDFAQECCRAAESAVSDEKGEDLALWSWNTPAIDRSNHQGIQLQSGPKSAAVGRDEEGMAPRTLILAPSVQAD
jgi:hypothetical protein